MPQTFITRAVVRAVRRLPAFPSLSVLDLSCGEGEILSLLKKEGCQVLGTRYRTGDYIIERDLAKENDVAVRDDVDLLGQLPFADQSFDVVVLVEVLEHLPSHERVLREAARVLRTGGHLLITTPNIARVHSRFWFFLSGSHKLIRRRVGWDVTESELYAYHTNPVDFPLFHSLLAQSRLHVVRLGWTRFRWKSALWLPLYPLFALAALAEYRGGENAAHRAGENDLRRLMWHPALLASEQLFVLARRQ
jgi:SAM-dependent methyltransferase